MPSRKKAESLLSARDPATVLADERQQLKDAAAHVSRSLRLAMRRQRYHGDEKVHGLTDVQWATAAFVCVLSNMSESMTEQFCARRRALAPGPCNAPVLEGGAVKRSLLRKGVRDLAGLWAHLVPHKYRHALLRAIVFICELQVFDWILAANMRGVFPWTRDVAVQLRVKALALAGTNHHAQATVSHWLDRPGGGEWNGRKWGQRFRRRWGLKYGRGIILTPMTPTEMERKAFVFSHVTACFLGLRGAGTGVEK